MQVTRASAALSKQFETHRAQAELSKASGIPPYRLSRLASGLLAWADEAVKLEEHAGIPVAWWGEPVPDQERATGNK